jgi:predicted Zn-dependent protease
MGHITARHTASQQSKQQMGQLLLIGGIIASKEFQEYAEYAMQGMQLLFMKFSRDNEREADRLGVEYSSKIGYDAHKMADFFQVLNRMNLASDHAGIPTFMSTHPDPGDRYNSVNQTASEWQTTLNYPSFKVNSDSYLRMIDGLVYGDDPRQGYVEGNTFYHPEMKFKFTFPASWQLENSPLQVTMAPKDGKAMMIFTLAQKKTLEEAAKETIEQLGLTVIENKKVNVNGMPALVTVSKQVSQDQATGQQSTIIVLSYFIDYSSTFYVFHGLSKESDYNSFSRTLETSMTSFSKLTDPSKLNVKPDKIIIKPVQRDGTLSEFLKSFGFEQKQMTELALLNNMELTDKVQNGKLIKIIGK